MNDFRKEVLEGTVEMFEGEESREGLELGREIGDAELSFCNKAHCVDNLPS